MNGDDDDHGACPTASDGALLAEWSRDHWVEAGLAARAFGLTVSESVI